MGGREAVTTGDGQADFRPRGRRARPVSLLCATLALWGCGDAFTAPAGPDAVELRAAKGGTPGKPGDGDGSGGGGGSSSTILVTASGALVAGPDVVFDVWTDNRRKLAGGAGAAEATWDFARSQDAALADLDADGVLDGCFVDGNKGEPVREARIREALARLVDGPRFRALSLSVDKNVLGAASSDHNVGGSWEDEGGRYDLGVGTIGKLGDPATVTLLEGDIDVGTSRVLYTGGSVNVKDRTESSSFSVFCPNLDQIELEVAR